MKHWLSRGLALLAVLSISGAALADTVSTNVRASVRAVIEGSGDLTQAKAILPHADEIVMLSGTSDGEANLAFADQRTISASSNEDLDLAGSLTTPVGTTAVFVEVTAILILADDGNTNDVEVSPSASNGFLGPFADASDVVSVAPGGALLLAAPSAGWTVTAGTADLLNVANAGAGTSVTYDVIIIGRDA